MINFATDESGRFQHSSTPKENDSPSLFTTGSLANRILLELFYPCSRQSILLRILRQISARNHSQVFFMTYIGDSSALHSSSSCRGRLEMNCGETSHWETLLFTFRNSYCLGKLLPSTSVWWMVMVKSFSMISPAPYFVQKYGVSPMKTVRHCFWSFLCIQEGQNNNSI